MNIDPMSEGLLRQRRNVISISCVLVFLKFAEVKIHELTFLGIDFGQIGNPSAVYLALWIFYFYFLFRYYQYFFQEGKIKLTMSFNSELDDRVMSHVKKLTKKIHKGASYHPSQLIVLKNQDWMIRVTYRESEDPNSRDEPVVENIQYPAKSYKWHVILALLSIAVNSSVVTDYLLPFLVVLFVLIYCVIGGDSSFISTLRGSFA